MDAFFAQKDAKKKSKGKKIYTETVKVAAPVKDTQKKTEDPKTEGSKEGASTSATDSTVDEAASVSKKKEVIEDGWVQDMDKEIDLSGLKIAEYVAPVKDIDKNDPEQEEQTWAKKQIEAGIPDMQVDIGSDGKTEQQIAEEKEKAVWRPSWRNRQEASSGGQKPPTVNAASFPSLQQTMNQPTAGAERAVGLKSFTEVQRGGRGGDHGSGYGRDGYLGGYNSSSGSQRNYGSWSSSREPERGNRFESLGRR